MSLGLLVSALASKLEQAVALVTLTSITQIALNWVTARLSPGLNAIAMLLPDRWGLAAAASSVDLNRISLPPPKPADALWQHTSGQWATDLTALAVLAIVYVLLATLVLRRRLRRGRRVNESTDVLRGDHGALCDFLYGLVRMNAQMGQICLAGAFDPLPDRGEPVVPGRGKRADRDRDQAGQRVDTAPLGSAGQAAPPAAATCSRPAPGRRDRIRPRAPARNNATAGDAPR